METLNHTLSGLVPYYYGLPDSNAINVYRFDGNGHQIFKTTIEGVKGRNERLYISLSKTAIYIGSENSFFILNKEGQIISSKDPLSDNCYYGGFYNCARPDVATAFVGADVRYSPIRSVNQWYRYDNIVGSKFNMIEYGKGLVAMDSQGSYYLTAPNKLTKMSVDGAMIYDVPKIRFSPIVQFWISIVDRFDFFYGFAGGKDGFDVYKFDNKGRVPI